MGQANVKPWIPDIMPFLTDEDPLGVEEFATIGFRWPRRLRRTTCSSARPTARSRSCSSPGLDALEGLFSSAHVARETASIPRDRDDLDLSDTPLRLTARDSANARDPASEAVAAEARSPRLGPASRSSRRRGPPFRCNPRPSGWPPPNGHRCARGSEPDVRRCSRAPAGPPHRRLRRRPSRSHEEPVAGGVHDLASVVDEQRPKASSCHRRRCSQASSPMASARFVELTMSVNRKSCR